MFQLVIEILVCPHLIKIDDQKFNGQIFARRAIRHQIFLAIEVESGQFATDNLGGVFPNMSGNSILNQAELISWFSFSGPVSGAAFNFVSTGGDAIFTAFLGAVEVEQFTALTGIANDNFYGFKDISFDSISIDTTATEYGSYALDNLQVASSLEIAAVTQVPEPESYAMFMAGLGLMGFIARRRKDGQS